MKNRINCGRRVPASLKMTYVIWLVLSAPLTWGAPAPDDAVSLIRAMGIDQATRLQVAALISENSGDLDRERMLACIEHAGIPGFTGIHADAVTAQLSGIDLRDSLAFYQSGTGSRVTEVSLDQMYRHLGFKSPFGGASLTADDIAVFARFVASRAGMAVRSMDLAADATVFQRVAWLAIESRRLCLG